MTTDPPPRFLADAMLGRLARRLRTLGFDTFYDPAVHDPELVAIAAVEERVLITRDRHLVEHLRPQRVLLITRDAPLDPLREVVAACGLTEPAASSAAAPCAMAYCARHRGRGGHAGAGGQPRHPGPVSRCPGCGRVYWEGLHTRRMRDALSRALPGWVS